MAKNAYLEEKASQYLERLCRKIDSRRVGSQGNCQATDFFAETCASYGFKTESLEFECLDWKSGPVVLKAGEENYKAFPGPYSLGWSGTAPLVSAASVEELEQVEALDKILFLHGEPTREQLMPKNFPFYNPDHHKQIYKLLERKRPLAIIAATSRNPELAGGMYPFPLIEDGDFNIPSVYMTEEEGRSLLPHAGSPVSLSFSAERIPSLGFNVYARKGRDQGKRLVVCAHIDAKPGTPGALDNATGIVTILLLAELLEEYAGELVVELISINGEDYYGANGEIQLVEINRGRFEGIVLAVNLDAVGYFDGKTHYSFYETPEQLEKAAREVFAGYEGIERGEQWYQGDHSVFIQNGCPAVAITSQKFMELSTFITHTEKDRPELVDRGKLVEVALALKELVEKIDLVIS